MGRPEFRKKTPDGVQDEADEVMGRRPGESMREWMNRLNQDGSKRKYKEFKKKHYRR